MKNHPELKKTEIGRIPKEWSLVRLGNICNQRKEIIQPSGKGHLKFIGLEHVESGKTKATSFDIDLNVKSSKFKFYADDILYGKLRPYLDKAVIVGFEGISSTDLIVLSSERSKVLTNFLIYIVHDKRFVNHAVSNTSGTNHPRTSWSAISKYVFALPPIYEQKKIAEVLSAVDGDIEKTDTAIEKTEKLKRGLMQRLLTRGLGHKEFKNTNIRMIPKVWDYSELSRFASIERGKFAHRPRNEPKFYGGNIPFVQTGDISKAQGLIKKYYQTLNEDGLKISKIFRKGTIVMSIAGNIGDIGMLTFDSCFPDSVVGISPDNTKIDSMFLMYMLMSLKKELNSIAPQSTQKNINLKILGRVCIPVPPLFEQQKISQILSSIDNRLELLREKKGKLERVKRGLTNDLLTGKRRVSI